MSYVPDVFGANRRQVESLAAQAEASRFELDATYLTLTANVVTTAIQEAGLRAQIAGTERVIALERESLAVLRRQLELGAIAEADVYAQDAALAQLEGTLPPLKQAAALRRATRWPFSPAICPPSSSRLRFELEQLMLPTDLPLGVPSQLVERRPDVRAAEAQLHAATAQVGVAIANMLPQVRHHRKRRQRRDADERSVQARHRLLEHRRQCDADAVRGRHAAPRKRAADAALDQAAATYRSTVLTAFQNVADALHALDSDADALKAASRAEEAAQKSLGVAHHQLELGSVSYLALLSAELAYQQARGVGRARRAPTAIADTAALFQALGGSISPEATRRGVIRRRDSPTSALNAAQSADVKPLNFLSDLGHTRQPFEAQSGASVPMCGIVGVVAERNAVPILMEGLRRLEYRGYDSAGIAVLAPTGGSPASRAVGKVKMLEDALEAAPIAGHVGIAHTRWATHGVPTQRNAHPHVSRDGIAIVHNGIIENHEALRAGLIELGLHASTRRPTPR